MVWDILRDLKPCIHSAPLSEPYVVPCECECVCHCAVCGAVCVCECVCQALKVKQDVFSSRRPFQSRQIPDNLSKFPWYRPRIIQLCLFPSVCSKVGNRKLGPFFPQTRPKTSSAPLRSESDQTPGSGCSGRRNLRWQCWLRLTTLPIFTGAKRAAK